MGIMPKTASADADCQSVERDIREWATSEPQEPFPDNVMTVHRAHGWLVLRYPAGRRALSALLLSAVGMSAIAAPFLILILTGSASFGFGLAVIFGVLVGLPTLAGASYMAFNSLEVRVRRGRVSVIRRLRGFVVAARDVSYRDVTDVKVRNTGALEFGRQSVQFYAVELITRERAVQVAESLTSPADAVAVREAVLGELDWRGR